MNQKDLIKYALLALGAYLIYKYVEDNGGISAVLGTSTTPSTTPAVTGSTTTTTTSTNTNTGSGSTSGTGAGSGAGGSTSTNTQGTISQRVLAAATAANEGPDLNFDQWCFYYQQVTGSGCPIDPGAIPASVYAGAIGSAGDRTTALPVNTWLAIMQNQLPALGLSGLGKVEYRYTPSWLM